jgi:N-methylhydantoinase A/oxoprolinase/acetone carboxylase beta subunit
MLTATRSFDFARSMPAPLPDVPWPEVRAVLDELLATGSAMLARSGVPREGVRASLVVDMRHQGQGDSISVALGETLERDAARQVEAAFDEEYLRLYGRRPPGVVAEVLTWRLRVSGPPPEVEPGSPGRRSAAERDRRPIWSAEDRRMVPAAVVEREQLAPGDTVDGPAVVQEHFSTVVIGTSGAGRVEDSGALVVTVDG